MVVTASRKEAVRWMKAMTAYIKKQGYPIGLLVAFSGEVERIAEAERRRRNPLHIRIADEVAAAWQEPARRGHRGWLTRAADAGFGEFVGVPMPGDQCFAFDAGTWQAAFLF